MNKGLYKINMYGETRWVVANDHKDVDKYIEENHIEFKSYTCEAGTSSDSVRNHRELVLL